MAREGWNSTKYGTLGQVKADMGSWKFREEVGEGGCWEAKGPHHGPKEGRMLPRCGGRQGIHGNKRGVRTKGESLCGTLGLGGACVGREGSRETAGCTQAAAPIPRSSGRKATGSNR